MQAPDFACSYQLDKNHIKILVSGRIPSKTGWQEWTESYWIPQVRLPGIQGKFQGVRDLKVKRIGGS